MLGMSSFRIKCRQKLCTCFFSYFNITIKEVWSF